MKVRSWIPPLNDAVYKITVERSDGTIDDITTKIKSLVIKDGSTESIGGFEAEVFNVNNEFSDKWTGNEIFRFYCDYDTTATTLRFRGRIEKPSHADNMIKIKGRSEAVRLKDIRVTGTYSNMTTSDILKSIILQYASDFTTNNVKTESTVVSVNWSEKPFFDCVEELCAYSGYVFYIDCNLDCHYFSEGEERNVSEAIVEGTNLFNVSDFAPDITQVRNVIKVYGAIIDGIQVLYTASDSESIAKYGRKEDLRNNENLTTYEQAKDYGDYYLNKLKDPPIVGSVTSKLLATLQPGQSINISSPTHNIAPNSYLILEYEHHIEASSGRIYTKVTINKEPQKIEHVLKKIIRKQEDSSATISNPYQMEHSYDFLFNEDSGTHSSTEISDGYLKLQSGETNGTWISETRTTTSNVSEVYLKLYGDKLDKITVYVSADNGINYTSVNRETRTDLDYPGQNLIIRVRIIDPDARLDSLSLQYK